jgi:hypothetical protein
MAIAKTPSLNASSRPRLPRPRSSSSAGCPVRDIGACPSSPFPADIPRHIPGIETFLTSRRPGEAVPDMLWTVGVLALWYGVGLTVRGLRRRAVILDGEQATAAADAVETSGTPAREPQLGGPPLSEDGASLDAPDIDPVKRPPRDRPIHRPARRGHGVQSVRHDR